MTTETPATALAVEALLLVSDATWNELKDILLNPVSQNLVTTE